MNISQILSIKLDSLTDNELLDLEGTIKILLREHQATQGKISQSIFLSELQKIDSRLDNIIKETSSRKINAIYNKVLIIYFKAIPECRQVYSDQTFINLLTEIENLGGEVKAVEFDDGLSFFANPSPPVKPVRPQVFDAFGREFKFYRPVF